MLGVQLDLQPLVGRTAVQFQRHQLQLLEAARPVVGVDGVLNPLLALHVVGHLHGEMELDGFHVAAGADRRRPPQPHLSPVEAEEVIGQDPRVRLDGQRDTRHPIPGPLGGPVQLAQGVIRAFDRIALQAAGPVGPAGVGPGRVAVAVDLLHGSVLLVSVS